MLAWDAGATKAIPPLPASAPPRRTILGSRHCLWPCRAKKPATSSSQPTSTNEEQEDGKAFAGVLSKSVLLRAGAAVFALGFLDAGYSEDWSRIGAISKDTEDLLKLAAYLVVPLCLFLIFSVSEESKS